MDLIRIDKNLYLIKRGIGVVASGKAEIINYLLNAKLGRIL